MRYGIERLVTTLNLADFGANMASGAFDIPIIVGADITPPKT